MRKSTLSLAVLFSGFVATASFAEPVKNGINLGNGINMGNGMNLGNGVQTGDPVKPSKSRKANRNGGTVTSVQMPAR